MNPPDWDLDALMRAVEREAKACTRTLSFRAGLSEEELARLSPAPCRCISPMISRNGSGPECLKCGRASEGQAA